MNCRKCGKPMEGSSNRLCDLCEKTDTTAKGLLTPFIKIISYIFALFLFLVLFRTFFPPGEGTIEFQIVTNMALLIGVIVLLIKMELERRDIVRQMHELEASVVELGYAKSSAQQIRRAALLFGLDDLLSLAGFVLLIIAVTPLAMALILVGNIDAFLFIVPYALGLIGIGSVILVIATSHKRTNWKSLNSVQNQAKEQIEKPQAAQ